MPTNIGTGPQDIPLNQFLGEMAFMDNQLEFGAWDPVIVNLGNHTKSNNSNGWFQRIGSMVLLTFNYQWSGRTTSNGGYGVKLVNIPYRSHVDYGPRRNGSVWVSGMEGVLPNLSTHPNRNNAGGYIDGTDIMFRLSTVDTNVGGEVSLDGSQSTVQTSGYIYGGALYHTDGRRFIS